MRDISNRTKAVTCQDAKVFTADTDGTTVDRKGFESLMFVVNSGIEGDTLSGSVKFDFILQHSDDDQRLLLLHLQQMLRKLALIQVVSF